jgi:hypothetical protein
MQIGKPEITNCKLKNGLAGKANAERVFGRGIYRLIVTG